MRPADQDRDAAARGSRFGRLALVVTAATLALGCDAGSADLRDGGPGGPQVDAEARDGAVTDAAPPDAALPTGAVITTVEIHNPSGVARTAAITFGQIFAPADVPAGSTVEGRVNGTAIALQVDDKATHADGSLRHAVITAQIPTLDAGAAATLELVLAERSTPSAAVALSDLLASDFDAHARFVVGGVEYGVSARALLLEGAPQAWLSGPLVSEWIVGAAASAGDVEHPHLAAYFHVRAYAGVDSVRVDVVVENGWTFVEGPQNFTYDFQLDINGAEAFRYDALTHYSRARWHQVAWSGDASGLVAVGDPAYLIRSQAVPNYDRRVRVTEEALSAALTAVAPMENGDISAYMPMTGAAAGIGPLPRWSARYLISGDPRARASVIANGTAAGSYGIHMRDRGTGLIPSLDDYPRLSSNVWSREERIAQCVSDCDTPLAADRSHQPSLAYLPYLLTGDYFFLEELLFWANYNMLNTSFDARGRERGLLHVEQVRGQAWALRTLGHAAYITPDDHPMKGYFVDRVGYNLDWYNEHFVSEAGEHHNSLGINASGSAFAYSDRRGVAPWQDDFFTSSVGTLVELGFEQAEALLRYKARFSVGRLLDPGFCWVHASSYFAIVREPDSSAVYGTFAEVYEHTVDAEQRRLPCGSPEMASHLTESSSGGHRFQTGEMVGYAASASGYVANMQPGLAVSSTSGVADGRRAWEVLQAAPVLPDYTDTPQFAVIPRD